MKNLNELEEKLGLNFNNKKLLIQALTHRSYLNETIDKFSQTNERLEFLGDSLLSFVISDWLFQLFPGSPEGTLTAFRSNLVNTSSLAQIAQNLNLGHFLRLSRGEKQSGGSTNPNLTANCLEAIIGAIFKDQGFNQAEKFIKTHFESLLNQVSQEELKDHKSLLQEKLQAQSRQAPVYRKIKEEGPDHAKTFTVGVYFQNRLLALSKGKSKRAAEEAAAKLALEKLGF